MLRMRKKKQVAFVSKPWKVGNALALYSYVQRIGNGSVDAFWYDSPEKLEAAYNADALVFTHGIPFEKRDGQLLINLWHGMPLKGIVYTDTNAPPEDMAGFGQLCDDIDLLISTSPLMRCVMAACFKLDARKVAITGQPRNDWLFEAGGRERLASVLGPKVLEYEKIIFYMPTWRSRTNLHRPVEGRALTDNIFKLDSFDLARFRAFLGDLNALLVCKFHINDEAQMMHILPDQWRDGIVVLRADALSWTNTDLYHVLSAADLLITDYSSVYFDYLLLDRPTMFVPVDVDEYRAARGFLLEPYEFWTPGPKVLDQEALEAEILACLDDPTYGADQRHLINSIINEVADDSSCERVWQEIQNMLWN